MKINFDADMRSVHTRLAGEENNIRLSPEQWQEFVAMLERPTQPNENLRLLLTEPSVLERINMLNSGKRF
jgi:uncharacterized protein (DUF1778 family)